MSLDGISPKHAVCTHCGFQLGGIPIRDNRAICPECGRFVIFELPTHSDRRTSRSAPLLWVLLLAPPTLIAAIALWETGWKDWRTASLVFVGMLAGMSVVLVLVRALRRSTLR